MILRLAAVIRAFVKDTSSLVPLPICCIHDYVCGLGVSDLTRIPDDAVHGESGEPQTQWVLWHEMKPHPPPTHTPFAVSFLLGYSLPCEVEAPGRTWPSWCCDSADGFGSFMVCIFLFSAVLTPFISVSETEPGVFRGTCPGSETL